MIGEKIMGEKIISDTVIITDSSIIISCHAVTPIRKPIVNFHGILHLNNA